MNGILDLKTNSILASIFMNENSLFDDSVHDRDDILRGVELRNAHDRYHHDVDVNVNSCERVQHTYSKSKHLNRLKPRQWTIKIFF